MKAKEAKQIAKDANIKSSQYNDIVNIIKNASNKGNYDAWYYNESIKDDVREKLTADGYKIGKTVFDRNETLTRIEWG